MADYTMIKGMADWQKKYNDFVAANQIIKSDWQTTGMTFLNGCSSATPAFQYRTIDIGTTQHIVELHGWITFPAMSSGQTIEAVQLPISIFKDVQPFFQTGRFTAFWGDSWLMVEADPTTGIVRFTNLNADRASSSLAVDLSNRY